MANTDKKGAGQAAGAGNRKSGRDQQAERDQPGGHGSGAAKPSGDSPKPHGDPLLHVVKDKE